MISAAYNGCFARFCGGSACVATVFPPQLRPRNYMEVVLLGQLREHEVGLACSCPRRRPQIPGVVTPTQLDQLQRTVSNTAVSNPAVSVARCPSGCGLRGERSSVPAQFMSQVRRCAAVPIRSVSFEIAARGAGTPHISSHQPVPDRFRQQAFNEHYPNVCGAKALRSEHEQMKKVHPWFEG